MPQLGRNNALLLAGLLQSAAPKGPGFGQQQQGGGFGDIIQLILRDALNEKQNQRFLERQMQSQEAIAGRQQTQDVAADLARQKAASEKQRLDAAEAQRAREGSLIASGAREGTPPSVLEGALGALRGGDPQQLFDELGEQNRLGARVEAFEGVEEGGGVETAIERLRQDDALIPRTGPPKQLAPAEREIAGGGPGREGVEDILRSGGGPTFATELPDKGQIAESFARERLGGAQQVDIPSEAIANATTEDLEAIIEPGSGASPVARSHAQLTLSVRQASGGLRPNQQRIVDLAISEFYTSPMVRAVADIERNAGTAEELLARIDGDTMEEKARNSTAEDQTTLINALTRMRDPGNRVTSTEFAVNREFQTVLQLADIALRRIGLGQADAVAPELFERMIDQVRLIRTQGRAQLQVPKQGAVQRAANAGVSEDFMNQFLDTDALVRSFAQDPADLLKELGGDR